MIPDWLKAPSQERDRRLSVACERIAQDFGRAPGASLFDAGDISFGSGAYAATDAEHWLRNTLYWNTPHRYYTRLALYEAGPVLKQLFVLGHDGISTSIYGVDTCLTVCGIRDECLLTFCHYGDPSSLAIRRNELIGRTGERARLLAQQTVRVSELRDWVRAHPRRAAPTIAAPLDLRDALDEARHLRDADQDGLVVSLLYARARRRAQSRWCRPAL